ncbi:MAG: SEL1-like repeat protein [Verrucomicrobiae bacterium]|nr:SEL1-like repeat protein [Verrucomicrobiae bacterium]
MKPLRIVFNAIACAASMVLISSCFEHDKPVMARGNVEPEEKLIGVWQVKDQLVYYLVKRGSDNTLAIAARKFGDDGKATHPELSLKGFEYKAGDVNNLVLQESGTHKWGYFQYQFEAQDSVLKVTGIAVNKNLTKEQILQETATRSKLGEYSLALRRTPFSELPATVLEADLIAYRKKKEDDANSRVATSQVQSLSSEEAYSQGMKYYRGNGVPKNLGKAAELIRAAAERGLSAAQLQLGTMLVMGEAPGPKDECRQWFEKAGEQGSAAAYRELGRFFDQEGDAPVERRREAVRYFEKAAGMGDAESDYYLGLYCLGGQTIPKDVDKALELLQTASTGGCKLASGELACLFYNGDRGVQKDHAIALHFAEVGRRQGSLRAMDVEAMVTFNGATGLSPKGVFWRIPADEKKAMLMWINLDTKLCDPLIHLNPEWTGSNLKDRRAWIRYNIALGYMRDDLGLQDFGKAIPLLREAAENGNADAYYVLGSAYESGSGVNRNYSEAMRLYRRAAAGGSNDARRLLFEKEHPVMQCVYCKGTGLRTLTASGYTENCPECKGAGVIRR